VIGKSVKVIEGNHVYDAFAKDIDENGHLIIEKEDTYLAFKRALVREQKGIF